MMASQRATFRRVVNDPDNNWNKMICGLWDTVDTRIIKSAFQNFILNGSLMGWSKQEEMRKKYDCNIPWAILLDPWRLQQALRRLLGRRIRQQAEPDLR